MDINVQCTISNFREFLIISTCRSFIPQEFLMDETVFPERSSKYGTMYVEAEDKVTLTRFREITFVRVSEVLGIIYTSKSGYTKLKWRSIGQVLGRLTGEVTTNSLTNLFTSKTIDQSYAMKQAKRITSD